MSSSQQTLVGGALFPPVPRPASIMLSVMIARAPKRMIAPRDWPCVPGSKFDMMQVMWLIVGLVIGAVLAAPPEIRVEAMLSPSMQLLLFCGA